MANCNNDCFNCEWRQGKSVDDVIFCQNTRLIARSNSTTQMIVEMQDVIAQMQLKLDSINCSQPQEPKEFVEIPEEVEVQTKKK